MLSATSLELSPFVSRGGKLIIYHGWADQNIPPRESVHYYNGLVRIMGTEKMDEAVRLFMVPGMGHCGGGEGPNDFDTLAALEHWREDGKAPSKILASEVRGGHVVRTRPLCPYPQVPMYLGSGSIAIAQRTSSARHDHDPPDWRASVTHN